MLPFFDNDHIERELLFLPRFVNIHIGRDLMLPFFDNDHIERDLFYLAMTIFILRETSCCLSLIMITLRENSFFTSLCQYSY